MRYFFDVLSLCITVALCPSQLVAADVSVQWYPSLFDPPNVGDRLKVLTQKSINVDITGELLPGDYEKLLEISNIPVPIGEIFIRSEGGSVEEALKISQFVYENDILVKTDDAFQCVGDERPESLYLFDTKGCGCASACALIWLMSPLRQGSYVKVHRPYFDRRYFSNLSDNVAVEKYNDVVNELRNALKDRGYDEKFIGKIFRTPAEKAELITAEEIQLFPINYALDELTSARCVGENSSEIAAYYHYEAEYKKDIHAPRPQAPDEINPESLNEYKKQIDQRIEHSNEISSELSRLRPIYYKYLSCKDDERINIIWRQSDGRYLSEETRKSLDNLYGLLSVNAAFNSLIDDGSTEIIVGKQEIDELLNEVQNGSPDHIRRFLYQN